MPEYNRYYRQGGTYFFTAVSYRRRCIFNNERAISLLWNCFKTTIKLYRFSVNAVVILPDHIHTIWTLPENDSDFSTRWKIIKSDFSRQYKKIDTGYLPKSLIRKGEVGIWQRRFWEHLIRDQEDFNKHCDYIHYNPVKHGLVKKPAEWKYSSFDNYVKHGYYDQYWGISKEKDLIDMDLE